MGFKVFGAETLTAADVNNYLMRQVVPSVANATEQNAIPAPEIGMKSYRTDTPITYRYNGTTWKPWESGWIAYTATLGQVTGTFAVSSQACYYKYVAGRVRVKYYFVVSTMGLAPTLTLPVTSAAVPASYATLGGSSGSAHDVSAGVRAWVNNTYAATSTGNLRMVLAAYADISATAPFTWAAGDILQGEFEYDPA